MLCLLALPEALFCQDSTSPQLLLWHRAVDFALQNNIQVKNAQLDATSAIARVGEIRAIRCCRR